MMALWGNARANACHPRENAAKPRYWGANILRVALQALVILDHGYEYDNILD